MFEDSQIYQKRNNFQAEMRRITIDEIIKKNRQGISKKFKNLNHASSLLEENSSYDQNNLLEIRQSISNLQNSFNNCLDDFESRLTELREKVSDSYDFPIDECLNSNLIDTLFKILEPQKLKFSKITSEALWILINISAFSQSEYYLNQLDVKTLIFNCLSNTDSPCIEVKKNAIWLANNLMSDDKSFTLELIQGGILYELTSNLTEKQIFDQSYLFLCKEMIGVVVSYFQDGADFNKTLTTELVSFIYLF